MSTVTTTQTETITVTGTDIRQVAAATHQEILDIYAHSGRAFPYGKEQLRHDLGQIYLFDMTDGVKVEFYDRDKVERLSYEFVPGTEPDAVHSPPGTFPRHEISADWDVRVIAKYSTRKPQAAVREFFEALGWRPTESLKRTGQGTTQRYGSFRSGDFSVSRDVYKDLPPITHRSH